MLHVVEEFVLVSEIVAVMTLLIVLDLILMRNLVMSNIVQHGVNGDNGMLALPHAVLALQHDKDPA